MRRKFPIAHIGDLAITGTQLAVLGSLLLWLLFTLLGIFLFALALATAVLGGLLATLLHWLAGLLHHLGHAWAAQRTGYPMREVRLLHVLAISIYPRDEPELPAETHIKRALGGLPVNILLGLIGLGVGLAIGDGGGLWYLLAMFFGLENLLLYGLGAFLPLGFTDGSVLLEWWAKRGQA